MKPGFVPNGENFESVSPQKAKAAIAVALAYEARNIIYRTGERGTFKVTDDESWEAWRNALEGLDKYIQYLRKYEHDL